MDTIAHDFTETIADHASSWWFNLLDAFFQLKVLLGPTLLQILGWAVYPIVCLPLFARQVRGKSLCFKPGKRIIPRKLLSSRACCGLCLPAASNDDASGRIDGFGVTIADDKCDVSAKADPAGSSSPSRTRVKRI